MPRARIREALYNVLTGDAQLSAIIGNRLFWDECAPEETQYPLLDFGLVHRFTPRTLANGWGVTKGTFYFRAFGYDQDEVDRIIGHLFRILGSLIDADVAVDAESVNIKGMEREGLGNDTSIHTPEDPNLRGHYIDFNIMYAEDLAS